MSRLHLVLAAVLLGIAVSASSPPSTSACTCRPTDLLSALLDSDVIFSGTAVWSADPRAGESTISSADPIHYHFAVDRVYKGEAADSLLVISARFGASCGYSFKPGKRYLVYAWAHNDTLTTGLCTRNAPLERAGEDLAFLETVPNGTAAEVDAALTASARDSLDDPRPEVRSRALSVYAATADPAAVRHALLKALQDPAIRVRATALNSWQLRIGRDNAPLAPVLPLLQDPEPYLRQLAVGALAGARQNADSAAAALIPLTRDPDLEVRRAVANTLKNLDDAAPAARELLLEMWRTDPSSRVRVAALCGLPVERPPSEETVARLQAAARDTSPEVRAAATVMLGYSSLAEDPWSAVLRVGLLADPDPRVRNSAGTSVRARGTDVWRRVPPGAILPVLAEAAKDTAYGVYSSALAVLGMTGRREAAPILVSALDDPRDAVRNLALYALGDLGPAAVTAVPRLRQLEAQSYGRTKALVGNTLRRIEASGGGR